MNPPGHAARFRFAFLAILWLQFSSFLCDREVTAAETERPHLVVMLSDDHTWRDSTVYGSNDIKTPNMQRIAATGLTFENAFVASPSCAPSRAALLTGLYPARNGAEANHSRPQADLRKLPAYLQKLGYEVVAFGKVGHYRQTPEYGFDVARHFNYHEDIAVDRAVDWLEDRRSGKPLCLFVGTNWPHVPWPEEYAPIDPDRLSVPPNHVDSKAAREWRARYAAAVGRMDRDLGKVYDAARKVLGDDVFFMHTSDHGAQWPFGKWTLYDDGIRTPLIVSWPGRIAPGRRTKAMVSWIDILPTLVDVAGGPAPQGLDGRSFREVLLGQTDAHRNEVFTAHSGDGDFNVFPIRSVRTLDGWKYIRNLHPEFRFESHVTAAGREKGYWPIWLDEAGRESAALRTVQRYQLRPAEELYDTKSDPYEQQNLAGEANQQEMLGRLRGRLDKWLADTGDQQTVFGNARRIADNRAPNIVTVFIDDMGWSDLSCFGGKRTETQHIDRLATEGLRFTNFYVNSPICSPSRVALSTGQYPQRHRITSYLAHRQANRNRGVAQWLDPAAPMLARQLQRAGYATGHFGKWHMGGQRDVGNAPLITRYGFDRSLTNFEGLGPRVLPLKDAYDGKPPQKHDLGSAALGKGPIIWEDRSRVTARFVSAALEFIDQAQIKQQPFYINLWPDDVHSPFFPPEDLRNQTDGSKRQLYYKVLDAMDEQLGLLFDRIRNDQKLCDNTLILVMSDNGHEDGAGSSDPLRGAKTWLYEGGIRSPLIVWGPGLLAKDARGQTNGTAILCALDVNRSLYSLAGIEPDDKVELDGEPLLSSLLGKTDAGRKQPIFWRRPPDRPGYGGEDNPDLAVRDGNWKFLVNYDGSGQQLYDLNEDPVEAKNLAQSHPGIVERLHTAIKDWNQHLPADAGDPEWKSADETGSLDSGRFMNPIGEGADPWVIRDPNEKRYLWCMSEGNRAIAVHASSNLTTMGRKHVVWRADDEGPVSREVWAPELHWLDNRWYIYFAASDGRNENHLAYVLESRDSSPLGPYELKGPFATGKDLDSPPLWAIDMTVMEKAGKRYALWSGWDERGSDRQFLYIAEMASPIQLASPRVRLCDNADYLWERVEPSSEKRGLNEAPQVFQSRKATSVVYSCGASWLPTYKLGLLELVGRDPLDASSWRKRPQPVFQGTEEVYGVGHSCFVRSRDDRSWWHVYHAKRDRKPGWRRGIFVQPMQVGQRGYPVFKTPRDPRVSLERPSGWQPSSPTSFADSWDYYGHHQFLRVNEKTVELGVLPQHPVNVYRSGEKILFKTVPKGDVRVDVHIDFLGASDSRDAGLLFRTTAPSVGFDAQRGYFAGLIPQTGLVILGRMDGTSWQELARGRTTIDTEKTQRLSVQIKGDRFTVLHNDRAVISHQDQLYRNGRLGLRVVDTHARFSNFGVHPLQKK